MDEIGNFDLAFLLMSALSVLVGIRRGASGEILKLAVYLFSGVLGYAFVPYFQPMFFSFLPHPEASMILALIFGTFVSWIILRIFTSSLNKKIKNSQFGRLDSSLGAVFGMLRAFVLIVLLCFVLNFAAPKTIENSRILMLTSVQLQHFLQQMPEKENDDADGTEKKEETVVAQKDEQKSDDAAQDEEKGKEAYDFKKAVLSVSEKVRVNTVEGEKTLLSAFSNILAKTMSDHHIPMTPELTETILKKQLSGKTKEEIREELLQDLKDSNRESAEETK